MKFASSDSTKAASIPSSCRLQLACLAASPAAVRAAIDAGADWVRIPYRANQANALDFKDVRPTQAIRYVHGRGRKLALDLSMISSWDKCREVVAWAAMQRFDALVVSDFAFALYCSTRYPAIALHVVAPSAISARSALLLKAQLNAARILIPTPLSPAQLVDISRRATVEVEVLVSAGIFSPNDGLDMERATADAPCNDACYSSSRHRAMALQQLPLMASLGIRAIQVEPRSDTPVDVSAVTHAWRSAIDKCNAGSTPCAGDPARQWRPGLRQARH